MKTKQIFAFTKTIDQENRRLTAVISSDQLDRDSEIIEAAAIAAALPAFAKNPTLLACHQHRLADGRSPVIGSWDVSSFKQVNGQSLMSLQFADTPLGQEYWSLYRDGHMRAFSIGFRLVDGREEMREQLRVYVIAKIELFEISCVPVGANREALAQYKDWFEAPTGDPGLAPAADLDKRFTDLETKLQDVLDILADRDGFGEALLGGPLESSTPAGDPPGTPGKSERHVAEEALAVLTKVIQSK